MALSDSQFNTSLQGSYDKIGIRQSKPGNDYVRQELGDVGGAGRQGLAFGSSMEPYRENAIQQGIFAASNPQATYGNTVQGLEGQAADHANMLQTIYQLHGQGLGSQVGAHLAALNAAHAAANEAFAQRASPLGQGQAAGVVNDLSNQAYGPAAGIATSLANTAEGNRAASAQRSASHQQGGLLNGLTGLASSALTGGLFKHTPTIPTFGSAGIAA